MISVAGLKVPLDRVSLEDLLCSAFCLSEEKIEGLALPFYRS